MGLFDLLFQHDPLLAGSEFTLQTLFGREQSRGTALAIQLLKDPRALGSIRDLFVPILRLASSGRPRR